MGKQLNEGKIPVAFEHKGITYIGHLSAVHGAGQHMWQLIGNGYFLGNLRYRDGWVFDSNKMPEMADYLGDYVTAWNE
jgi:hypothetical protein